MKQGIHNIPQEEYRAANGIANSDLQLFAKNPSDYIWSKSAPADPNKTGTADFGTALHTLLLEPEKFERQLFISSVKGRATQAFAKDVFENPDRLVLTEVEAIHIKTMAESAMENPTFADFMQMDGDCEQSIFVYHEVLDLTLKIRPDKILNDIGAFMDLKSTANIDDWRSDVEWKNPLFTHGYGFTAAYYIYVGNLYFKKPMDSYYFALSQKNANLGRYPATIIKVTLDELKAYGFWDKMLDTLALFSEFNKRGDFRHVESFPAFRVSDNFEDDIEVTFDGGENDNA